MGLGARTSILDGGYAAWEGEGRPVTKAVMPPKKGNLTPCEQKDVIVEAGYVSTHMGQRGTAIVDARLPGFYTGDQVAPNRRAGHIPGATNIPFSSLLDDKGKLWPADTLRQMFQRAGIRPGDRVVSYCHIGQQATLVYFVARYLGFDARLYDGSWEDWSAHKELPATTAARGN
jgi:thiosulfate/3-mercaptopyruvate sulfurtransferase